LTLQDVKDDEQLDYQHGDILEEHQTVVLELLHSIEGVLVDVNQDV
jgi:hypothetical protein